jgi:hypothetical protein
MDIFDVLHACNEVKKKKNQVNKNQGWESIHQKYEANENTSRHNPKKTKTKANNQQKSSKDLVQRGLMVYTMTINDNKENLR